MAQLIKMRTSPTDSIHLFKSTRIFPKLIIDQKSLMEKQNSLENSKYFRGLKRLLLQQFFTDLRQQSERALNRGRSSCELKTIADIILSALLWQKNVEIESSAAYSLAKITASNIIGSKKLMSNDEQNTLSINNKLRDYFDVKLATEQSSISDLLRTNNNLDNRIKNIFIQSPSLKPGFSQLQIFNQRKIIYYDIEGINIKKLVGRVSYKYLQAQQT